MERLLKGEWYLVLCIYLLFILLSGTLCDPLLYKYTKQVIVVLLKSVDDDYCEKILCSFLYGPAPSDVITISGNVILHHKNGMVCTEVRDKDSTSMETLNKFLQDIFVELNDKSLEAAVFINCFKFLSDNLLQLEPLHTEYERGVVLYVVADMCEHKMEKTLSQLGSTQLLKMSSQLLQYHCDVMSDCKISIHNDQCSSLYNQVFGGQITMSIALGIVTMVITCSQNVRKLCVYHVSISKCFCVCLNYCLLSRITKMLISKSWQIYCHYWRRCPHVTRWRNYVRWLKS